LADGINSRCRGKWRPINVAGGQVPVDGGSVSISVGLVKAVSVEIKNKIHNIDRNGLLNTIPPFDQGITEIIHPKVLEHFLVSVSIGLV
jgi:hypothetical protein